MLVDNAPWQAGCGWVRVVGKVLPTELCPHCDLLDQGNAQPFQGGDTMQLNQQPRQVHLAISGPPCLLSDGEEPKQGLLQLPLTCINEGLHPEEGAIQRQ